MKTKKFKPVANSPTKNAFLPSCRKKMKLNTCFFNWYNHTAGIDGNVTLILTVLLFTSAGCIWYGTRLIRSPQKSERKQWAAIDESGYPYTGVTRRILAEIADFLILSPIIALGFTFQYHSKILCLAMLRLSVECLFNFILLTGRIFSLWSVSNRQFLDLGEHVYMENNPILNWVNLIYAIWTLTDVTVFLVNPHNRSLHDFIAGTVVVTMDKNQA